MKTTKLIMLLLGGVLIAGLWNCKKHHDAPHTPPPIVDFISPVVQPGVPLLRVVNLAVNANAQNGKTISNVKFYVDDVLLPIGTITSAPWQMTYEFKDKFNQNRVIRAVATDDKGETGADTITVTIFNAVEKTKMPTPRYAFSADAVNGKIYVVGGYNNDNTAFKVVEEYDPATDKWAIKAPPPTGHATQATAVVNNILYVFGGDKGFAFTDSVDAYNPATNTWAKKTRLPSDSNAAVAMASAAQANGKVYLMGGLAGQEPPRVAEYDPVADKWRMTNSYRKSYMAEALTVNNTIYFLGGCPVRSVGFCDNPYDSVFTYNPGPDNWTVKKNMLYGHSGQSAVVYNNKIYVFGGVSKNTTAPFRVFEIYDPATNTWTAMPNLPFEVTNFGAAVVGNKIYIIGETHVYEYTPD